MQQGSGIILIIVGLLVIYAVVTGKYPVFEEFFYKLFNLTPSKFESTASTTGVTIPINTGVEGVNAKIQAIQKAIDASRRLGGLSGGVSGKVGILN